MGFKDSQRQKKNKGNLKSVKFSATKKENQNRSLNCRGDLSIALSESEISPDRLSDNRADRQSLISP